MLTEYINQTGSYYLNYVLPSHMIDKWIVALAIFIFFFIVSKGFLWLIEKVILAFTAKTKTEIDDMLVERTNKPLSWLLVFIGIRIGLEILALENGIAKILENINESLILFILIYTGMVIAVVFIDHWGVKFAKKSKSKLDDVLIPLFRKSVWAAGFIMIAIVILDRWGVNVAGILAGVGIAGLALGFALQDSLGNIFGGISLIVSKTFHVGDKIEVDGVTGNIMEVGIRATRIKTFNNELVIVPNSIMANTKIKNYHQPNQQCRVVVPFGVEYGSSVDKVRKVALDVAKSIKGIVHDKDLEPSVIFKEMADSSLKFELRFWVDVVDDVYPKLFEANEKLYAALNKARIGIPFPCVTVFKGK